MRSVHARKRTLPLVAGLLALLMIASACGQKEGVAEQVPVVAGNLAAGDVDPTTGGIVQEDGTIIDPNTGEVIATTDGTTTTTAGTTQPGSTTTTPGGSASPGPSPSSSSGGSDNPPASGNSTGVTSSSIKIGIHAPITGAAPVPSASFEKGKSLYFNYMKSKGQSIGGRNVEVVSENDNYNPSQAVAVCKEMVENDKVFLLYGVAGTDQIQACAKYAATVGVPYLSGGVTEVGLVGLDNYFALWMSYKQQGPLLADLYADMLGASGEKNGMVRFNAPTFQDAHDSFFSAMDSKGADVEYDRTVSKTASATDAQTVATEMCRIPAVQNVFPLTSPTWFLQLAQAATCKPQYAGMGLTMGLDTVAKVGCSNNGSIDKGLFLSPFPAFFNSNTYDPEFRQAGGTDDIEFGLWGSSKVIWQLLTKAEKNLTREGFIYSTERSGNIHTGVFPDVEFSPTNHFGGKSMHLIRANCSANPGRFETVKAFATGF